MTRRCPGPASAVAAAILLGAAGALALAGLPVPPAKAAPSAQRPTATPWPDYGQTTCALTTSTTVQPGAFRRGEPIAVTRTARAACADVPQPLHVVLVLDASASMAGEPSDELRSAMRTFVEDRASSGLPDERLGVVSFERRGRQLCALTDRYDRVQACIRRVRAEGEADLAAGLQAGWRSLQAGRALWPTLPPEQIREVIILVSSGHAPSCPSAVKEAGKLAARGVLVVSVCAGDDCDVPCMRSIAASPRYYFEARDIDQLVRVFQPIRHAVADIVLKRLTMTETLPSGAALVADSPQPPVTRRLEDPTRLVWELDWVSSRGVTVTYRVRPGTSGYVPLSDGMRGVFRDKRGLGGAFDFARPWARVLGGP